MNKNAKKWLAALRSGKYKQGSAFLNRAGKFCCLGVACELYAEEYPDAVQRQLEDPRWTVVTNYIVNETESRVALPSAVRKWLGLRTALGTNKNTDRTLSELNDGGCSFNYIAAYVERYEDNLFTE